MTYVAEHPAQTPTTDPGDAAFALSVQRSGPHAAVQVRGPFTQTVGVRMTEILEWLFDTGTRDVHVELDHPPADDRDPGRQFRATRDTVEVRT